MRVLQELAVARAALIAGLTTGVAVVFWVAVFVHLWIGAHVDTSTDSKRAMDEECAAELALGAVQLAAALNPDDAALIKAATAARIRAVRARAAAMDPKLMNHMRLNLTLFENRVISFISHDGYEVQLLQQPGMCWAGNWAFVTSWRHGSRPLYKLAGSIIICYHAAD